jgi:hypothetical protein
MYGVFINKDLQVFDDIKTIQTNKKHKAKLGNALTSFTVSFTILACVHPPCPSPKIWIVHKNRNVIL